MSGSKQTLTLILQPQEFFRQLVVEALSHQKISTRPETEFYLVNLLNQFISTDRLFPKDQEGNSLEKPLALMIKEAMEQPKTELQRSLFRQIGDLSLYIAGYFQSSLSRKLVDVDYYIDMGGAAYKQVEMRATETMFQVLYRELSEKFASLVEVLAEISEKTTQKTEKDLLRIYEHWLITHSDRDAKQLKEAGIIPNQSIKKNIQ